jgi:beta-N-acetylhexosaminidase
MVMVGFRGATLTPDMPIYDQIRSGKVAGVILFQENSVDRTPRNIRSPQQLSGLISQLRSLTGAHLMVALDQEGGLIDRLSGLYGNTLSGDDLGKSSVSVTVQQAETFAQHMKTFGINVNLAPVVDLNLNQNGLIEKYHRSFSADPGVVATLAQAEVETYRRYGIATTLKHFPGYGSVTVGDGKPNALLQPPDITDTWQSSELQPYSRLIARDDVDMVMAGNQIIRSLDPQGLPAALSPKVVTELLRKKLGFNGVVISDDLQEGVINNPAYGPDAPARLGMAVRQVLLAGTDILLFANNNPQAEYDDGIGAAASQLVAQFALQDRQLCRSVEASLRRIDALKARLG